jgi:hypothetical protein
MIKKFCWSCLQKIENRKLNLKSKHPSKILLFSLMQNSDNQIIKDSIVYNLELDYYSYPINYPRKKKLDEITVPYFIGMGVIVDILIIIEGYPNYNFYDIVSIFTLSTLGIVYLYRKVLNLKPKPNPYDKKIKINEENIHWYFGLFNKEKFAWLDVKKVEIHTYRIKFHLQKGIKTLILNKHFNIEVYEELMQEIKLNIRALCIKLNIPCEENPDCKAEQEITRKIKNKYK